MSDSNDEKIKLREKRELDAEMLRSIAEHSPVLSNLIIRNIVEKQVGPLTADNFKAIVLNDQYGYGAIELMLALIFRDETIDDIEKKQIWLLLDKYQPEVARRVLGKAFNNLLEAISRGSIATKDIDKLFISR